MKSWSGKWVCFQPWASNDFEVAYFLTKPYPTEVIIRVRLKFGGYPLVNSHITMGRSTMLCSWLNQHKSTISMAIFNSKLWMFTRPGSPIHGITLWKIMASRWCQTMGFYMNFPGQNGLLKLTGDWCHVYFHAKKKSAKFLGLQNCRPNSFPLNLSASVPSCSGWETLATCCPNMDLS